MATGARGTAAIACAERRRCSEGVRVWVCEVLGVVLEDEVRGRGPGELG